MAEVKIAIGGREFEVACRDGEEHFLQSAALLLDNEAGALNEALGRMPETRMLLMAGLMLADKTASLEDQLKQAPVATPSPALATGEQADDGSAKRAQKAEAQLSEAQTELAELKAELAEMQAKADTSAAELAEAQAKADASVADLAEVQAKVDASAVDQGEVQAQVEAAQAKIAAAEEQRNAAIDTMKGMVKQIESAAGELKKAS